MSSSTYPSLDFLFHPRSIALAGVTVSNPEHWTRTFLDSLIEFKFEPLYLVNPKGGEIYGRKVYTRLEDVPGDIDHVISTVPASAAPGLILEAARKGVKSTHFCTSGFGETGEPDGTRLEKELAEAGRKTGIRIIGPNCMGIYCPRSRLSFEPVFPRQGGSVGYISQSGGNATSLIVHTMHRGVRFSKVISFGNACALNESDYLEYLTDDPETNIICLYLEGVKDPARFWQAIGRAAQKKVVLLLKGGVSESGARAATGHTGALAGSEATWEALCRQLGIIRVTSLEELANVLVTLLFMPLPRSRRCALIGFGGGASVLITDTFEKNGLRIPPLAQHLRDEIRSYTPIAGNIFRNPIDYSQTFGEVDKLARTLNIVAEWDDVDFIVVYLSPARASPGNRRLIPAMIEGMLKGSRAAAKPFALVIEPSIVPAEADTILNIIGKCTANRLPIYYDFASIARALDIVISYGEKHPEKLINP